MPTCKRALSFIMALLICVSAIPFTLIMPQGLTVHAESVLSSSQVPEGYEAQNVFLEQPSTYSLRNANTTPRVLLVEDVLPWDSTANQEVLGSITQYDKVTTGQFLSVDLSRYGVIVFANDQPFSTYNSYAEFKEYMELFASIGGVIVFGACDAGWADGTLIEKLPGDVSKKTHYVHNNYVVDSTHPIVSGSLTDNVVLKDQHLYENWCSHVSFDVSSLPAGAKIILRESDTDRPTLVEYPLGRGRVIASGLTWEFNWVHGGSGEHGQFASIAMEDMFRYAIRISSIDMDDIYVLQDYFVNKNAHHIVVSDETSQPIVGASVTIDDTAYATDQKGEIVYSGPYGKKEVTVRANGYRDTVLYYDLQAGSFKAALLESDPQDGKPYVTMASNTSNLHDLRYQAQRFVQNDTTQLKLSAKANWGNHGAGQFVIYQDNYQKTLVSTNGNFTLTPGKDFAPNQSVKLKLIANDGVESTPIVLNIRVDPVPTNDQGDSAAGGLENITDLQLSEDKKGETNDSKVSSIFPGSYELKISSLPVEIKKEVKDDGTTVWKGTIGIVSYDFIEKEFSWHTFKSDLENAQESKDAMKKMFDKYKKGAKVGHVTLEKELLNPEVQAVGYLEITQDKNGNTIKSSGGVIIQGSNTSKLTKQFLVGPVPLYLDLTGKVQVDVQFGLGYDFTEEDWIYDGALKIEGSIALGGGLGVSGIATVGVEGSAGLSVTVFPKCTGEAVFEASLRAYLLFVIDWKYTIGKKTIPLWGQEESPAAYSLRQLMRDNEATFEFAPRDYNDNTSEWNGYPSSLFALADNPESIRSLQDYIMPNSLPELVELDGQYFLFFHTDKADRTAGNNVMLMYSVYDKDTDTWAEPLAVASGNSSDLYAEYLVADNELYVVWQKIRTQLEAEDAEQLLNEMSSHVDISYAKWNKTTGSFEQRYIRSDSILDMYPQVAVNGENVSVVWVANSENDATGETGTYTFYSRTFNGTSWGSSKKLLETDEFVSEIAAGYVNGKLEVVYTANSADGNNNVYRIVKSAAQPLAAEGTVGEGLSFNNGCFYWVSEGTLACYDAATAALNTIQSGSSQAIMSSYRMVSNGSTNAIAWLGVTADGRSVICASIQNATGWSEPISVFEPDFTVQYFDADLTDDGSWNFVLTASIGELDEGVSLVYANVRPQESTVLNYVDIDETAEENGTYPLSLNVTNNGQTALQKLTVRVEDNQGTVYLDQTLTCLIGVGETVDVQTSLALSSLTAPTLLQVYVCAENEWDTSDNMIETTAGRVDVRLEVEQYVIGNNVVVTATVKNLSPIPANVGINLHINSEDGIILDMKNIGILTNESDYVYRYSIDKTSIDFGGEDHKYYFLKINTLEEDQHTHDNVVAIALHPEEESGEHIHYMSTEDYGSDNTIHWMVCDDCGENFNVGAHLESDWLPTKAPTCTEDGYAEWKNCTVCGAVTTASETLSALGHEYGDDGVCRVCKEVEITGFTYRISNNQVTILAADPSISGAVVIPAMIGAYPVTRIDAYAFSGCSKLTSVTIPEGVTTMGGYVFSDCPLLTEATLPSTLTAISSYTFYNCIALKTVTVPNGIASIGAQAFRNCRSLTAFNIPASVTNIAGGAFRGCTSLKAIVLPDALTSIAQNTFYQCTALTSIKIPQGVTSIANYAFFQCSDTLQVYFAGSESDRTAITIGTGNNTFANAVWHYGIKDICFHAQAAVVNQVSATCAEDGYSGDTMCILCGEVLQTGEAIPATGHSPGSDNVCDVCGEDTIVSTYTYTVENGEVTLTDVAASSAVGAVILPSAINGSPVTAIGENALRNCRNITELTIPESIISIGNYAFKDCTALTTVHYNATACISAGTNAYPVFHGCSALTTVYIGKNVQSLPPRLFRSAAALTKVYLTKTTKLIGANAFYQCESLSDVYYVGKATDFKATDIKSYNTALTSASFSYNTACFDEHMWDAVCDTLCDFCSKRRTTTHIAILTDKAVAPTCTAVGFSEGSHCVVCNNVVVKQNTIPALGHRWDDGTVTKQPTADTDGEKIYTCTVCDATKTVVVTTAAIIDGYYYIDDVLTPNAGLIKVEDAYYFITSTGAVKTGRYAVTKTGSTGIAKGIYYFFEDGKMNFTRGVYEGKYYNDQGLGEAYAGLVEVNGSKYYIGSGGNVTTGRYFISKLNGLLSEKRAYTFFDDGRMLENTCIYSKDGYYYEEGIRVPYAGLIEYEGNYYYVTDGGKYVTSRIQIVANPNNTGKVKNGRYYFGQNGQMLFNVVRNKRYFGADGMAPHYSGVVQVGDYYYYVSGPNGELAVNKTVTVSAAKSNGLLPAGKYKASSAGSLTPVT